MQYRDLRDFIAALEEKGELKRIRAEVDPYLEMTEICDRTLKAGGPALLFENVKGHSMPVLGNKHNWSSQAYDFVQVQVSTRAPRWHGWHGRCSGARPLSTLAGALAHAVREHAQRTALCDGGSLRACAAIHQRNVRPRRPGGAL